MSKLRIYELAKELGVDNRVVISAATELGMHGKASHSNSLDSDEADKLRRFISRQSSTSKSPDKKEVVTTRVDKVTGAQESIVERRSGNVIRRRRAAPGSESSSSSAEQSGAHTDFGIGEVISAQDAHTPSLEQDSSNGHHVHDEPIETHEPSPGVGEEQVVESAPLATAEIVTVQEDDLVKTDLPHLAEEEVVTESVPVAEVVEEVTSTAKSVDAEVKKEVKPEEPKKSSIGPKVLGRIALPAKRVVKPVESPKKSFATPAAPAVFEEEEEEGKKGAKKKTRKREIDRFDLIDYEGRDASRKVRSGKSAKRDEALAKQPSANAMKASKKVVKFSETITVGELAKQMSLKAGEIIAKLMELGMMATINQALDVDTATVVASEFDYQVESTTFDEKEILVDVVAEQAGDTAPRPPVVTVMGHVDHGKTSLLDAIRNASVAAKEHGGITQHIGAYRIELPDGRFVTFIDTPGHAAFTSMRARGATVTDIVILVVAADEGVMPQTLEALSHAKAAGVPIVVAVNKMDKQGASPDRVKQQLAEHGLSPEEWGGDTMYVPVSAAKKTGIKELLEAVLLVAEVKEFKANPDGRAKGTVIESRQDKGRGAVATVLVQNGTLRVSDIFVCGAEFGKVRSMVDHTGLKVDAASASFPVEITGFNTVPDAGDDFIVVESEAKAREVAQNRAEKKRQKEQRALATGPISLEEFARRANNLAMAELSVILKADVHGSVEAVRQSLEKLSTEKVKVRVLHASVGGVTDSDLQLAVASKAIIVGFGVRAEPRVLLQAEQAGVDVRFYRIIYELIDEVKKAMAGLLDPIKKEAHLGQAEVRNTFVVPKIGTIAGCFVIEGLVRRGAHVRLLRDNRVIFEGKMGSLRRFKDDAKEVQNGYECGVGIDGFNDIKIGDIIDVYEIQEFAQSIE